MKGFFATAIVAVFSANATFADDVSCTTTVDVQPDFEPDLLERYPFGDRWPDVIDFEGEGPHYIEVYLGGVDLVGRCMVVADVVNRETLQRNSLFTGEAVDEPRFLRRDFFADQRRPYQASVDGVRYSTVVSDCRFGLFNREDTARLQITQALEAGHSTTCESEVHPLTWEMIGEVTTELDGPAQIISVTRGADITIGVEVSDGRSVSFSLAEGLSRTQGLDLVGLQGTLQNSIDFASQAGFDQTVSDSFAVTLDGDVCESWSVQRLISRQLGQVTAPSFGAIEPIVFQVTIGRYIEATPLCE